VLLDLDPKKYEKPKDYLFFDFYSLYAKNTIENKRGGGAPEAPHSSRGGGPSERR
jgi:hypothetical protein